MSHLGHSVLPKHELESPATWLERTAESKTFVASKDFQTLPSSALKHVYTISNLQSSLLLTLKINFYLIYEENCSFPIRSELDLNHYLLAVNSITFPLDIYRGLAPAEKNICEDYPKQFHTKFETPGKCMNLSSQIDFKSRILETKWLMSTKLNLNKRWWTLPRSEVSFNTFFKLCDGFVFGTVSVVGDGAAGLCLEVFWLLAQPL